MLVHHNGKVRYARWCWFVVTGLKGLAAVFETAQFLFELLDVKNFFHFFGPDGNF